MNINDSQTLKCENFMDSNLKNQWDNIDWKEAEMRVNRLQIRIAKATKEKDWNLFKNGRNNSLQTTIFQFPIFELPDTERG